MMTSVRGILLSIILLFAIKCYAVNRVPATRPNSWSYHNADGYSYNRNRVTENSVYFKCVLYNRQGCNGRAVYNRFRGFRHTQPHNHPRQLLYPQYCETRQRILERCRVIQNVRLDDIIEDESRNCHRAIRAQFNRRPIQQAITRARRKAYPRRRPQTVQQLAEILQTPRYRGLTSTIDGEDNLFAGSVRANDGTQSVIFSSRRLLNLMRRSHTILSDGTFRSVPQMPRTHQVFVIITLWNFHIVPLAWVLMERRTEPAYRAVLAALAVLLGPEWRPRRIITDWERPQRNAWRAIFPNATLQGCYWHFCRAILLYAKKRLGLQFWIQNDRFLRGIIRLCTAIPLLPLRYQARAALLIAGVVRRRGRYYRVLLRPFLLYIWRQWVMNAHRRRSLDFCRTLHRTTNACESHNRTLNRRMGVRHPDIYTFIGALRKLENRANLDIENLEQGLLPSKKRRASAVNNDRSIKNLLRGLRHAPDRRRHGILRFLYTAAFTVRGYFNEEAFRD